MRMLFFVITILALSSCSSPELKEILINKISHYESCKEKYFDIRKIEILRRERKPRTIEYKIEKDSLAGYGIIQTYPNLYIFKNIYSDSIDLDLVNCLSGFNEGMAIRLLKFKKKYGIINFELKVKDKLIILSNIETLDYPLNLSDSSIFLDENWSYSVKQFVGEK